MRGAPFRAGAAANGRVSGSGMPRKGGAVRCLGPGALCPRPSSVLFPRLRQRSGLGSGGDREPGLLAWPVLAVLG